MSSSPLYLECLSTKGVGRAFPVLGALLFHVVPSVLGFCLFPFYANARLIFQVVFSIKSQ